MGVSFRGNSLLNHSDGSLEKPINNTTLRWRSQRYRPLLRIEGQLKAAIAIMSYSMPFAANRHLSGFIIPSLRPSSFPVRSFDTARSATLSRFRTL